MALLGMHRISEYKLWVLYPNDRDKEKDKQKDKDNNFQCYLLLSCISCTEYLARKAVVIVSIPMSDW